VAYSIASVGRTASLLQGLPVGRLVSGQWILSYPFRREASYGGTIMSRARKMSALGLSWGSDVNWALACLAIGVLFTLAWAVVPA
jgi:hypothetical protein